jgi:hypothetical protein
MLSYVGFDLLVDGVDVVLRLGEFSLKTGLLGFQVIC